MREYNYKSLKYLLCLYFSHSSLTDISMMTITWSLILLLYIIINDVFILSLDASQMISSHVLDVSSCEMQGDKEQITTETEQDCKFACLDRFRTGRSEIPDRC